jgi:hypothetical protein
MFCARCGQQIADATVICPHCGGAASVEAYVAPPSPQTAAAAAVPGLEAPLVASGLRGVGGWLLFFCIGFTILWPLWTLSQYAMGRFAFRGVAGAAGLIRLGFGIVVGAALWTGKPAAMTLLRIYFALSGALLLWSMFNWARISMHYNVFSPSFLQTLLLGLGLPLVLLVSGVLYFSKSERVRATYGSKLFDGFFERL